MKKTKMIARALLLIIPAVSSVAYGAEQRVDGQYVSRHEYEKLKDEVETLRAQLRLVLEKEQAPGQTMKSAEAEPQAEAKSATAAADAETHKPAEESPQAEEELSMKEGDRQKEAEEAKRALDEFLRDQKLLFKEGELQFEFGASYAHDSGGSQVNPILPILITRSVDTSLLLRYGLADDLEFDLTLPAVYSQQEQDSRPFGLADSQGRPIPPFSSEDGVGLGDINWALRYAAWHEDGTLPEITLNVDVKSDTGDEERRLGTGFWNVGGGVTLVKTIDPVVFFGSLGYTWTLEQGNVDPGDRIPYSVGMGFSLNDRVSFLTTLAGAAVRRDEINGREASGSGQDIDILQFSTTVQLDKGLFLEPFVGFGLTDESQDFIAGINVPFRLDRRYPLPFFHQ
jgi:hypothetical protein